MSRATVLAAVLLGGRIAEALAGPDADVEASIEAYERGDYDEARARLDEAISRRGERPELLFNRGLLAMAGGDRDAARADFERATESEDSSVRASAHYELGNLAFDEEDWDGAIEAYVACLKLRPDHDNAKWNLELALDRKRQEEEQQEQQDQQDQQDQQAGENQQGEQDQQEGEGQQDEQDQQGGEDEQAGEDQQAGEGQQEGQDQPGGEDQQAGQAQQEQDGARDQGDAQRPDEAESPEGGGPSEPGESSPSAVPIDRADIDRALEELDREDPFVFGRPSGRRRKVKKDW